MYYHKEKDILFLCHQKTASTAVGNALQRFAGFAPSPDHHGTLERATILIPEISPDSTLVFTVVRNHFDWFVSFACASNNCAWPHRLMTERAFMLVHNTLRHKDRIFYHLYVNPLFKIYLVRFENLVRDVNRVLFMRGLKEIDIPRTNISHLRKEQPYQRFYSEPKVIDLINYHFKVEMTRMGYAFD